MLFTQWFQPYLTSLSVKSTQSHHQSMNDCPNTYLEIFGDNHSQFTPNTTKILTRENAVKLMKSLPVDSSLAQEIALKLLTFSSGIHSLSNGSKINATKERLLGGNDHKNERAAGTQELVAEARRESEGRYNILVIKAGHNYDIRGISSYLYKTEEKEVGGCRYKIYAFTQGVVVVHGDLGLINLDCWGPNLKRSKDRRTLIFGAIS